LRFSQGFPQRFPKMQRKFFAEEYPSNDSIKNHARKVERSTEAGPERMP
jgi:hypothetical protein